MSPSKLTIEAWFSKDSSNGTYNCVLHKSADTSIGASEYWLGVEATGRLTATIGARTGVGWGAGQTSVTAVLGNWYHLVATWNGSVVRVFVNGVYDRQYNLSSYSNLNMPTRIGASSDGASYQFPGKISKVKIYQRSLTDAEVLSRFNDSKSKYGL